jgi:pimeloyl-ACP methyl ester carboxylesterase
MGERIIRADNFELATEAFGEPGDPPVLLIMGVMASMLWWPDGFCRQLASRGRHVIRYDNRDTGRSTKYPAGRPGYGLGDLADDAFRVLDGYRLAASHIVGMSLGGIIGQLAVLKNPARVLSLTAIGSTPVGVEKSLPRSDETWSRHAASGISVNWSDRAQAVPFMVEELRLIAGPAHPFDHAEATAFIERDFDRSGGYLSSTNHALLRGGSEWRGRLHEVEVPLLVIHGTADPIFPIEHGVALWEAVRGAKMVRLEGSGHELHHADWEMIVGAIVEHTAR